MEEVSFLKMNVLQFPHRILKDEYTHTHFKSIGKAQFPSLLNRMWTSDPIGTKTNIVKSFMKAGIFPFNQKSITTKDHQLVLLQQEKKRKRKPSTIIGFDTSEEDGNIVSCIITIVNKTFSR